MNVFPALLGALWAVPLAWSAAGAASPERRDEDVLVTAIGDDPCCGSGVVAFAVRISGRVAEGERSYFIPFMAPGQAKPPVGGRCSISWRWWRSDRWTWLLAGGGRIAKGRLVTGFRCRGA